MASETMELECPSCKLMLEIDIAFAGGVCRCSSCGTLMTVPRDPKLERAESLRRPDRPGDPSGAPGQTPAGRPDAPTRPDAPAGSQTPAADSMPPVDSTAASSPRPSAPAGQPSAARAQAEAVDEGVYVTESGKQVRITSETRIPTAVKRKALKAGIVGGFVIVMVGMVTLVIIGIAFMLSSDSPEIRTAKEVAADVQMARGNYDPDVNPFLLQKANVLGLNLTSSVIVVLDTSNDSKRWLSMAADALIAGLVERDGKAVETGSMVQVIFARDGGPVLAPPTLAKLDDTSRPVLKEALFNTRPIGQATFTPALTMAVAAAPAQIILITAQDMDEVRLKAITDPLAKAASTMQFDVIYLGQQSGKLDAAVQSHKGTMVKLPVLSLSGWFQNWQDRQLIEPAP